MLPRRIRRLVVAPALVLVCVAATIALERRAASPEPQAPVDGERLAGADVVALLDGLGAGDTLANLRVRRILAPRERMVAVELETAGTFFTLAVAAHGATPHNAPRSTARYDLFFSVPADPPIPSATIDAALDALAARIGRTEARVPVPARM